MDGTNLRSWIEAIFVPIFATHLTPNTSAKNTLGTTPLQVRLTKLSNSKLCLSISIGLWITYLALVGPLVAASVGEMKFHLFVAFHLLALLVSGLSLLAYMVM